MNKKNKEPIKEDLDEKPVPVLEENEVQDQYQKMRKEIRSWGYWLIGLGFLQIILSGMLSSSWGILMVFIGLSAFYFMSASIFIVFATVLILVATNNFASLNIMWMILSIIQIIFAYFEYKKYLKFREIEKQIPETMQIHQKVELHKQRAAIMFPWVGASLGCMPVVLFTLLTIFMAAVLPEFAEASSPPPIYLFLLEFLCVTSLAGFAYSLASVISRYRPKIMVVMGMIGGVLTVILILIANFSQQIGS